MKDLPQDFPHDRLIRDTHEFYKKFFHDLPELDRKRLLWRMMFIQEEFFETQLALDTNSPEGFVDGLIDMMVVILGTLYESGVDIYCAWDEVHRANMTKVRGEKDTRPDSDGFDLIKPPTWIAPSHRRNVGKLRRVMSK